MPPVPLVFLLPYTSIFPLLCFFNIDSSIGLIFIHRHTNRSSSTHCTLLWRAINSRLTLGDRWARHPWHFLRDFHDRLPAACAEHMYPLTVFCLSLLGIRESAGVNRFPCTSGILYVCIHIFTWVYIVSMSAAVWIEQILHRRLHMDCIEERGYIFQTTFQW